MKEKLKDIGLGVLVAVGSFILAFILIFLFLNIFYNFNLIPAEVVSWVAFGCSIFVASFSLGFYIKRLKADKSTRLSQWLSQNYPKLILYYVVINIIFISLKVEVIWSFDSLKDAISLEWTIFGISIALFVVWNAVILIYLEKEKPKQPQIMSSIQKLEFIIKKEEFYPQASTMFNSITLLIINLIILAFATGEVFVLKGEEITLFRQNIVIVSFYLCTNTLIALLMDILLPLIKQKRAMLKEAKVTSKEIKEKEEIYEKLVDAYRLIQDIEKIECIDEELKLKMKLEILLKADAIDNCLEEQNDSTDSE